MLHFDRLVNTRRKYRRVSRVGIPHAVAQLVIVIGKGGAHRQSPCSTLLHTLSRTGTAVLKLAGVDIVI